MTTDTQHEHGCRYPDVCPKCLRTRIASLQAERDALRQAWASSAQKHTTPTTWDALYFAIGILLGSWLGHAL